MRAELVATIVPGFIDSMPFDPFLRGFLAVLVGVIVLCGSVYLLVATNTGPRLGLLISLAGLFGWLAIMGAIWWIYGIGWKGNDPSWELTEIVQGDLSQAANSKLRELPDLGDNQALVDIALDAVNTPGYDGPQPETVADELDLSGWTYLATSNRARGDAEAAASAVLTSGENDLVDFGSTDDYKVVAAFETGGKPLRKDDSMIERVKNRVTNTLRVVHPIHHAAIMVQPVTEQEALTGEAPPFPEADESEDVTSVLLTRNLGFKRLRPAIFTIFSTIIFALLALALHRRDKFEMSQRERAKADGADVI